MKEYNTVVYIGRFRPPHLAHIETMKRALEVGENLLILCGSANQPRTTKNPWNVNEINDMIMAALPEELRSRVMVLPLRDSTYNDQEWAMQVQKSVQSVSMENDNVAIIGYAKDDSSYYLKMFPQWKMIDVGNIEDIHATDIRNAFFEADGDMSDFDISIGRNLPSAIHDSLKAFSMTEDYTTLVGEYKFLQRHSDMWKDAPYPVTYVTCDAVVIQSGHVLMVRRRAEPGRGLWALSGGYLDINETIEDGIIRELREETKIKLPIPVIKGCIKTIKVYDAPNRSPRGRIITHVALIVLPSSTPLPKVKGSDDADKARWIPLSTFAKMEDQMFEDHFQIVNDLIGKM